MNVKELARGTSRRRQQLPSTWNALQRVHSTLFEAEARSSNKIADRPRYQHFVGGRQGANPRSNVYGDAAELLIDHFAFTGVNASPNVDTEWLDRFYDRLATANGARRAVKSSQETIAGRIYLPSAVGFDLLAHQTMVLREKILPSTIAQFDKPICRTNNVCEQYAGENAVSFAVHSTPCAGQKGFNLTDDRACVANPGHVISAWQLDILRSWYVATQIPTMLNVYDIACAVQDEGGDLQDRQDVTHVDLLIHSLKILHRARTGT